MSLRRLYRSIPKAKRICSYHRCQKPILRNIDQDKGGHIYHHGCLMAAQDERYKCLNCFALFDATEAALSDQFSDHIEVVCPHCGSINLRPWRPATNNILVTQASYDMIRNRHGLGSACLTIGEIKR